MRVLVIGSGGREHALVWALSRSASVKTLYAAPGNPGIAELATCFPVSADSPTKLLRLAMEQQVDLTVVGPEAPLVAGIVDRFRHENRAIIGPTAENARLEGSKIFAKGFFQQHGIPTARFHTTSTRDEACNILNQSAFPIVLKADGLAAGKGVIIANNHQEAEKALEALGPILVIEECLTGEEVSFIALTDGQTVLPLEPCQDHKRVWDNDQGPNTGGMGAYCDSQILNDAERHQILDRIIFPTINATGFTGFLYAGLILTSAGPKLLEFNVRLGDPETQSILYRLQSDLGEVLQAAAQGELSAICPAWNPNPSVSVVLASSGYPGAYPVGLSIHGISNAEENGSTVFQAGTRQGASGLETAGGRVLAVTARGTTLAAARENAYNAVSHIRFQGMHYRRDIGMKGLSR